MVIYCHTHRSDRVKMKMKRTPHGSFILQLYLTLEQFIKSKFTYHGWYNNHNLFWQNFIDCLK